MNVQNQPFEFTLPVVVIGGGACGCVAALSAKAAGAEVLLVEQDAQPAGSTAMSQGLMAAAGTASQKRLGIPDSPDIFFNDIITKTNGEADPVTARTLADNSGPTIDWLSEECGVPFEVDEGFHPSYGNTQYRVHGWHGHGGEDLVQMLHRRLADRDIDVMLETRLVDVLTDEGGNVSGVVLERPDGEHDTVGCEALILACGGFAANRAMIEKHMPRLAGVRFNGHEGSHGDGIVLGQKIGAAVGDMSSYQGYAMLSEPHGITVGPGLLINGGIQLNTQANRFVDESLDIAGMMHCAIAQPDGYVWVIYDERIEEACRYVPEVAELIALNAAKPADSLEEMAQTLGMDLGKLEAVFADIRSAKEAGGADEMGRKWDGIGIPPQAPYRALKVTGALYHTQGGLQLDSMARVLREDGTPIANLFAGGGNARAVSGSAEWGYMPAMGLCTAVTLGHVAGKNAAKLVTAA